MSINDKLNDVKKKLDTIKRNHRYKKANKDRAVQAELTYEIAKCAGDLGVCKKDFLYTIQEQSFFIRKGQAEGYNTALQEMQLEDAAIGYMLVNDALFALKSISSYDSVTHAYDLLDAATKKITGEKTFPFWGSQKKKPERSEYGFMNSAEAVEEKRGLLKSFFDKLILTGDIETCLEEARQNQRDGLEENDINLEMIDLRTAADSIPDDVQLENKKDLRRTARFNITPPSDE